MYLVGLIALAAPSVLAVGIIKAWDSHKMLLDTFSLEVNEMVRRHPIDQQWNWNADMLRRTNWGLGIPH